MPLQIDRNSLYLVFRGLPHLVKGWRAAAACDSLLRVCLGKLLKTNSDLDDLHVIFAVPEGLSSLENFIRHHKKEIRRIKSFRVTSEHVLQKTERDKIFDQSVKLEFKRLTACLIDFGFTLSDILETSKMTTYCFSATIFKQT